MLPRKNRISKQAFPAPKRQGLRVFSPLFSGTFYKNEGELRVAIVVSKKTAKTAVTRNLIRRRFYEILHPNLKSFTQQGFLVFYPKKETATVDFSYLKTEIESVLRKEKLII
ncbi:MAG: ribonuclease P protein component [Patescibacteria group bacterium]